MGCPLKREEKLRKYLSSKYMAASGGEVPDEEDDEDNEGESETPEKDLEADTAPVAPPSPAAADDKTAMPPEKDDASDIDMGLQTPDETDAKTKAIQEYLKGQYSKAQDDSGVKAAQNNASSTNFVANIGDALETIARANSMAHGGAGVDSGFYKGIKEQGQQGVQQAMANRDVAMQNFVKQNEIMRNVANDVMTRGSYDQQQRAAQIQNDMNDSSSQLSKNKQAEFKAIYSNMVPEVKDMDLSKFSADELGNASKDVDVIGKLKEMEVMKKAQMGYQQEMTNKKNAVADLNGLGKDLDSQNASVRTGLGVAQGKVNSATRLMTFADVTPDDINQAKNDPQTKTALIQKLNHLTPQQYGEVVSGLMNQISGGQGSFGQLESLKTNTADATAANVQQYFSSHPAPANVGALIYNNLNTLINEQNTSQAVLDKHASQMKAKHPQAFSHPDTSQQADRMLSSFAQPTPDQQPVGNPGLQSSTGPQQATQSPPKGQSDVVKQNGITYQWNGAKYAPISSVAGVK